MEKNNHSFFIANLYNRSKDIKKSVLIIAQQTQSHHIGSCLSIVDLLAVLYFDILKVDPKDPQKKDRDRLILSKGHAGLALYATLMHRGFFNKEELVGNFNIDGGKLGDHPDLGSIPGIDASSGSLGYGLSIGAGMALAAKKNSEKFRIFVILSDGECNEGTVWEAAMFAAHNKLDNITAIIDHNGWQGFGRNRDVLNVEPLKDKWSAFGWAVCEIDGHNLKEIATALSRTLITKEKPTVVIARTIKGKGMPGLEDTLASHYESIGQEDLDKILSNLD